MYENGRGVAQDLSQAAAWYYKAAQQGNDVAQCNLGFMFENGGVSHRTSTGRWPGIARQPRLGTSVRRSPSGG
jgi:TPR repeat protein